MTLPPESVCLSLGMCPVGSNQDEKEEMPACTEELKPEFSLKTGFRASYLPRGYNDPETPKVGRMWKNGKMRMQESLGAQVMVQKIAKYK